MLTVSVLLLTVFLSSSNQQCFSGKDYIPYHTTAETYSWVKTRLNFSASLFKALSSGNKGQNLIFSPWSIERALLLAYFGAKNETEASLATVLKIPAKQTKPLTWRFYIIEGHEYITKDIPESNTQMMTANKIFLSKKLTPRRCMKEKLGNDLDLIDYERDSAEWARNYINGWVESVTEGQIKKLYSTLSPSTSATIVNAVYFKSKWAEQFNPSMTLNKLFHVNPHDRKRAKMMVKESSFIHGYSKTLEARMLMLPYEGNRTTMIVLLPDNDLDTMIESLNGITVGIITDLNVYAADNFTLFIPKFEHKSNVPLGSALSSLGIGNALSTCADFSGFTGKKEVFFDDVIHEAVIQVGDDSATGRVPYFAFNQLDFRCDRPFAYIIFDFWESKVLFMGTFRQP